MKITYLDHSGFAVDLGDKLLIFDYYRGELPAGTSDRKLYVFSSHAHYDHFQKKIFTWSRDRDVTYILSKDIRKNAAAKNAPGEGVYYLAPRQELTLDGLSVRTLRSTDAGVAFLVECLLLFLVFCVVACLEFYTPLAIGHSFAQHKMLLSVAFFFAIQVVTQIVSGMLLFAGVPMLDSMDGWLNSLTPATAIHGFMWGSILISAIYGAILYCITIRMLHRHLNLE